MKNIYKTFVMLLLSICCLANTTIAQGPGCDQNLVSFDCYYVLGSTITIRNSYDFIVYQNILNSLNNNIGESYASYLFELSLADGCYTIQITNDGDNYVIVNMSGTDHVNGDQLYSYYYQALPYPFSVGGTGGCTDPLAVNYLPDACYSDNCEYGSDLHNVVVETCDIPNGVFDLYYDVRLLCNGQTVGYGGTLDGGHSVNRLVLRSGVYELFFYQLETTPDFTYTLTVDGTTVTTSSSLEAVTFSVGTGVSATGCTDFEACNYDEEAICEDNSCLYGVHCCPDNPVHMEVTFGNPENENEIFCFDIYDVATSQAIIGFCAQECCGATFDFCLPEGCYYINFIETQNPGLAWLLQSTSGTITGGDTGTMQQFCNGEDATAGCTDPLACNYNPSAATNDNSCTYPIIFYQDIDNDGYGNAEQTIEACSMPVGYAASGSDCNDGDAAINPAVIENICNNIDDNCNGIVDEGRINGCTNASACNYNPIATCDNGSCTFAIAWYLNADGDNYYASSQIACTSPGAGWTSIAPSSGEGDCNDGNAAIHPGAIENICNGIDDNCNGTVDEGRVNGCTNASACNYNAAATCDNGSCTFAISWYLNVDNDNFYASIQTACASPGIGWTSLAPSGGAGDCNDNNAARYPGAPEVCGNGADDDCDGLVDEGCTVGTAPANNNAASAANIYASNYGGCVNTTGNLTNATASPEATSAVLTGQDVWYKFTATEPGIRIRAQSTSINVVIELQDMSGNTLDVENINAAMGNETLNYGSLTAGQQYRFAVRNYNSAQGTGTFTVCISRMNDSYCSINYAATNFCSLFKAYNTSASSYVFNFTSTTTNITYTKTVSGTTYVQLSSVTGLVPGDSYDASVDAVYTVTNGLGENETILIQHISSCIFTINSNPSLTIRTTDACPFVRQLFSTIKCEPSACGASDIQWEFTRIAPTPNATFTHLRGMASLYLLLSTVPGLTNGTYNVRIRSIYSNGAVGAYGAVQCLQIGTPPSSFEGDENTDVIYDENKITMYPNPASEVLNLVSDEADFVSIVVMNEMGQMVMAFKNLNVVNTSFNLDNLAAGLYTLRAEMSDQRLVVQRFVKD